MHHGEGVVGALDAPSEMQQQQPAQALHDLPRDGLASRTTADRPLWVGDATLERVDS